jgi:4-oxalomesaconate hydratase
VLTHALEDPYNFDHPDAAHFAQEDARGGAGDGHKPGAKYTYPRRRCSCSSRTSRRCATVKPQVILNIDEVWDIKRKDV